MWGSRYISDNLINNKKLRYICSDRRATSQCSTHCEIRYTITVRNLRDIRIATMHCAINICNICAAPSMRCGPTKQTQTFYIIALSPAGLKCFQNLLAVLACGHTSLARARKLLQSTFLTYQLYKTESRAGFRRTRPSTGAEFCKSSF